MAQRHSRVRQWRAGIQRKARRRVMNSKRQPNDTLSWLSIPHLRLPKS